MLGVARMSTGEKYVVGLEFGAKAVVMGEPEKKGISGAAAEGREGVAAPEGQAAGSVGGARGGTATAGCWAVVRVTLSEDAPAVAQTGPIPEAESRCRGQVLGRTVSLTTGFASSIRNRARDLQKGGGKFLFLHFPRPNFLQSTCQRWISSWATFFGCALALRGCLRNRRGLRFLLGSGVPGPAGV